MNPNLDKGFYSTDMKIVFFCFLFFTFLPGCREKEVQIPPDILGQEKMTTLFCEIHLAQAANSNRTRNDTIRLSVSEPSEFALAKHQVEKDEFLKSLKFYSDHPKKLQQIYDSVITRLSRMEGAHEK